jgi:hypothetical protein
MKWIQLEIPFEEYKDKQLKIPFPKTEEEIYKEFDKYPPFTWDDDKDDWKKD